MTGRERVLRTLAFQGSDRIPMDIWVLPAARLAHGEAFADIQRRYADRVDIASFVGPFDHGFTPAYYEIGEFTDPWGSRWVNLQPGVVGEVKYPVLEDYNALKDYKAPTEQFLREWAEHRDEIAAQIAQARQQGKFIIGGWITVHAGWRWVFAFLAFFNLSVFAVAFVFLRESLPKSRRQSFRPDATAKNYARALRSSAFLAGVVGHGCADGAGAVRRGNARGDAFARFNGYGEGGTVPRHACRHEGKLKLVGQLRRKGQTYQPAGVTSHEIDGFGGHALGRHDQMAAAFTIVVVHKNDHVAVADIADSLFDGAKRR